MSYNAQTQGISDPTSSVQDKTNVFIRDPIEIILGSSISDYDCTLQNLVICYRTNDHYTTQIGASASPKHHLQRLYDIAVTAFSEILSASSSTYEPTTNVTAALVCYNLGRLMRETINDDTFVMTIQDLDDELRLSYGGTLKTDASAMAADVSSLWFAVGKGLEDMFGDWSFTEWKPNDDALAGLWMIWFYILFHWGVQCCTYFGSDYLRGIGEYITQGGAIEGRLKKLDPYNEKDWPLRFLNGTNGSGDVFGLTAAMVDNAALKGLQVPLFDMVEPFIQKYFSRSRWVWRYMRWVDVSPIYTIMPPKVGDKGHPVLNDAVGDFEYMALFESKTNCDWDWWNTVLLNFTQRLQRFKFRGKNGAAFGKLKSRIKLVNVFDLPEPGIGNGGMFWHQMTSVRIDVDVGGDDNFIAFKYQAIKEGSLDYTPSLATDALHFYRDRMQFYWYQLIGQIDVDMFRFLLGTHASRVYKRNGTTVAYINGTTNNAATNLPTLYNFPFSPVGYVIWSVLKDEDENYYLDPTAPSYGFEPLEDDSGYTFLGKPPCIYDWEDASGVADASDNYAACVHELDATRTDYLPMRSSDPYKKLKHHVYDLHNLDLTFIRDAVAEVYIGGSVKPTVDLAISAKTNGIEAVTQRRDGSNDATHNEGEIKISAEVEDDESEKIDDDISKISVEEQPISALPDEIKKMEKDLKMKKAKLKKEKEQEAKKKKVNKK